MIIKKFNSIKGAKKNAYVESWNSQNEKESNVKYLRCMSEEETKTRKGRKEI
jgi:hypothetical protein